MESALMTTPPAASASSSASADLPLAVGPAISTALPTGLPLTCPSFTKTSNVPRRHADLQPNHKRPSVPTLFCTPNTPALASTIVDGARAVLPQAQPAHWLFDGVAVDIPFGADSNLEAYRHAIEQRLRELRGDLPIDIVVQPVGFRRKKLFLADMDSTMIGQECIDELADLVGMKAHVAAITERAMRGEIEFEPALRERV